MDLGNLHLESHGMFKWSLVGQHSRNMEEVEGQLKCKPAGPKVFSGEEL